MIEKSIELNQDIKGIRIGTANMILLLISCLLFILLLYATVQISTTYRNLVTATENYIFCEKNASLLREGSDYLTNEVRLYVETLNKEHADRYFTEIYTTRRREKALETFSKYKTAQENYTYLENAMKKSSHLTSREIYAIKLAASARRQNMATFPQIVQDTKLLPEHKALNARAQIDLARSMVFNSNYQNTKELILSNISYVLNNIVSEAKQKQENDTKTLEDNLQKQQIVLIFLFLLNILVFLGIIMLIIKPLRNYMRSIKEEKMLDFMGAYEFKYFALMYNHIYEIKTANTRMLRHKAEHDPLTGILNRGAFDAVKQMFKTSENPMGLLLIDVDHFKEVNDHHGHETGDKILCKVAQLLQSSFRSEDFVIRLGGDEFVVIVMATSPQIKLTIEEKVKAINTTLQTPDDGLPPVTLSIGIAFSEKGFPDNLYRSADSALYEVKSQGRNGFRFYEP